MKNTISSRNSSWNGRSKKVTRRWLRGALEMSSSVTNLSSPVSFLSFFARRASNVGVYVSGTVKEISAQATPERINWIQYSHLQPFASARKPPTSGPIAGPMKGAAEKAA